MKTFLKLCLFFLFIVITANIKLPYIEDLFENVPFTEVNYLYSLLFSCFVFGFIFLVYSDPGFGIGLSAKVDFSPRSRAIVLTVLTFSICLFFAYARSELFVTGETMLVLSLLFVLYYNALISIYYLFAYQTDDIWTELNKTKKDSVFYHRSRKEKSEKFNFEKN